MNPTTEFCPNEACSSKGIAGQGNIVIHSRKERRYKCKTCGGTFSETHGTALYRVKKPAALFGIVVTLLAHGCPPRAIMAAYGLHWRTIQSWLVRAGIHSQRVHEQVIGSQQFDLGQVQADEIKVRAQGGSWWMAMAVMVSTRLWLGGVVGPTRDRALIAALVAQVRAVALCRPLQLTFDGLPGYVSAFRKAFRSPLHTGKVGRPRLVSWPDVTMAQVIKRKTDGVLNVERRIVQGGAALVARLIRVSQGGGGINTSYIERLNATFRARLFVLVRRSRALARTGQTLVHGMYLTGAVYNFCTDHKSLRQVLYVADGRRVKRRWVRRTPAMAAGLTDYRWTVLELMTFKLPPPQSRPPPRRSRTRRAPALQAPS